jgi:hypothetical protein
MQITSQAECSVDVVCPECGDMIPIGIRVNVLTCECGGLHQVINSEPDLTDIAAHAWSHL